MCGSRARVGEVRNRERDCVFQVQSSEQWSMVAPFLPSLQLKISRSSVSYKSIFDEAIQPRSLSRYRAFFFDTALTVHATLSNEICNGLRDWS